MSVKQSLIASTALIALSFPASAEITPAEVWTNIQTYYANSGMTLTATNETDGDDMILRDVVMTSKRDTGDITFNIPEISLEQNGDGVDVSMSETMTVNIPTKGLDGATSTTLVTVTQKDMTSNITGDAADMKIDFKAPETIVETSGSKAAEGDIPTVLRVTLNGMKGTETLKSGDITEVTSDFTFDSLSYTMTSASPPLSEEPGAAPSTFNSTGSFENTAVSFEMMAPAGSTGMKLSESLANGFSTKGTVKFGKSTGTSEVETPNGQFLSDSTSESSVLNFSLDASGAQYSATGLGAILDMTFPGFPMPIHVEMASMGAGVKMPMVASDEAAPIGMDLRMENLTVNEELWGLFDPSKKLPRTPATVIMALDGMAKLTAEITDPASIAPGAMPFELENLSLTELKIALLGADLTGTGAMTVDNTQPVPVPAGAVDLRLEGGNGLIDKLVETGLVPAEQLMGIRMMLGLFAVPAGDDVMTSKIEMRDDGGVYANGQRLR